MGNKARWGFCNNIPQQGCQTSDGNDADAAIGIGLKGQSTAKEMGAGWTEYFNSNSRRSILYFRCRKFLDVFRSEQGNVFLVFVLGDPLWDYWYFTFEFTIYFCYQDFLKHLSHISFYQGNSINYDYGLFLK